MTNPHPPSILLDFETVDVKPSAIVLDLAAVVFYEKQVDTFTQLVNDSSRVFSVKFNVKTQTGRTVGKSTLEWWAKQSGNARKVFDPSPDDVELRDGILEFKEFCTRAGVDPKHSLGYVRGASFDFPLMADIVDKLFDTFGLDYSSFPVPFWMQRDVRTAISFAMLDPHLRQLPVPKGLFEGFIKHNSVHDCCKDVILLQHAIGYGTGDVEIPDEFDLM